MKKLACLLILLVVTMSSFAQSGVDDYKYAQLQSKMEFQEVQNQYRINSTIKFFLEQRGFVVYYNDEIQSQDFASTNCNKFFVNLVKKSTLFSTKVKIELKDCTGKVLLASEEGVSREKELGTAYNEALRMALKSLERIKYSGKAKTTETAAAENNTAVKPVTNETQAATENRFARNLPKIDGLTLLITSSHSIYIASSGRKKGVVFRNGKDWFFEYYADDKLVSEKVYPLFD